MARPLSMIAPGESQSSHRPGQFNRTGHPATSVRVQSVGFGPNLSRRTPKEVERLIAAAKKKGRGYGLRDATMILVTFRHGLRVSELCTLTWDQIDFSQVMMHVRRIKNGIASVQQIGGEEMRMLRAL
jgi:integrase